MVDYAGLWEFCIVEVEGPAFLCGRFEGLKTKSIAEKCVKEIHIRVELTLQYVNAG